MDSTLCLKHYRLFSLLMEIYQVCYLSAHISFFLIICFYLKIILKTKMECAFLGLGDNEPCHSRPTKNPNYCAIHNFVKKHSKVKLCLRCGKGTWSKLQICNLCGADKLRVNERYHTMIKPTNAKCHMLRIISVS